MTSYKESFSLDHRRREAQRALEMGKIPIICERREDSALPELSTKKFVVSPTMSVGMFIKVLTERVNMEVAQQIFLFLGDDVLMAQKIAMSDLYRANREEDGFIYVTYSADKRNARRIGAYRSTHTYDERNTDAAAILQRGLLPVVVEKDDECKLRDLSEDKFEIDPEMPISTFVQLITTRVTLEVGRRIYLYVAENVLGSSEDPMVRVYERFREPDGFLYVTFSDEAPIPGMAVFPEDEDAAARARAIAEAEEEERRRREREVSLLQSPMKSRSMADEGPFKTSHSLPDRLQIAREARSRGKIPIICERRAVSALNDLANKKFLVAPTMLVSRFNTLLTDRVASEVSTEIFLFIGDNVLMARNINMQELYDINKDPEDGLLYVTYDDNEGGARHMGVYKSTHSENYRLSEAARALALLKTPIVVEKVDKSRAREIEQKKFWVPFDMRVSEFEELLRTRIADETNQKVYLFVDGRPANPGAHRYMKEFYDAHKDDDNFVYVTYSDRPTAH